MNNCINCLYHQCEHGYDNDWWDYYIKCLKLGMDLIRGRYSDDPRNIRHNTELIATVCPWFTDEDLGVNIR